MNKEKIYKLTLIFTLLLASCSNQGLKNNLEGQWAMEILTYEENNYISQVYTNVLIFDKNNKISIPETFHFEKDNNATWKVLNDKIKISTSNTVFNGTYEVEFISRTKTKPLGFRLKSTKAYIKAYKLLDFN
jgi:hypothetical protein